MRQVTYNGSKTLNCIKKSFYSTRVNNFDNIIPIDMAFDKHTPPKFTERKTDHDIIFLHGLFGSKRNYNFAAREIAKRLGNNVYCVDQRNHGDSPIASPHSYTAMAADLSHFVHKEKIQKPVLIGHSMGAKTVMVYALERPKSPAGIIPVDNAPVDKRIGPEMARYADLMIEIEKMKLKSKRDATKFLMKTVDPKITHFLMLNAYMEQEENNGDNKEILKFKFPLELVKHSIETEIGSFPYKLDDANSPKYYGPTLFIRGKKSAYVSDETVKSCIPHFFPNAKVDTFDTGHWVIAEAPGMFIKEVQRFVLNL